MYQTFLLLLLLKAVWVIFSFFVTGNLECHGRQISTGWYCWSLTFHSRAAFSSWMESDMLYRYRALRLTVVSFRKFIGHMPYAKFTFICHTQNKTSKTKRLRCSSKTPFYLIENKFLTDSVYLFTLADRNLRPNLQHTSVLQEWWWCSLQGIHYTLCSICKYYLYFSSFSLSLF